jgi:hypothetical protein
MQPLLGVLYSRADHPGHCTALLVAASCQVLMLLHASGVNSLHHGCRFYGKMLITACTVWKAMSKSTPLVGTARLAAAIWAHVSSNGQKLDGYGLFRLQVIIGDELELS